MRSKENGLKGNNVDSRTQLTGICLLVLFSILIIGLSLFRGFDKDEFESIKSSWKIFHGERIYVDFFQHHNPFFYYTLLPVFLIFREGTAVLIVSRLFMLPFLAGIAYCVFSLTSHLYDRKTAIIALLFLFSLPLFTISAIEVRPDIPQVFFGLCAMLLFFSFLENRKLSRLTGCGLLLGLSFMFLQKSLWLIIAVFARLLYGIYKKKLHAAYILPLFFSTMAIPLLYSVLLWIRGGWDQYFFLNYLYNSKGGLPDTAHLKILYTHVTSFNLIIVWGFLLGLIYRKKTSQQKEVSRITLFLAALTLLHGVYFPQYFLLVLSFAVVVSAHGFVLATGSRPLAGILALVISALVSVSVYIRQIDEGNREQLRRVEYVRRATPEEGYVHDGDNQFNLFRKDLDYFWYSISPGMCLDRYRKMRPYDYDIYALIELYHPFVISETGIDSMNDPRIEGYYEKPDSLDGLYIRKAGK